MKKFVRLILPVIMVFAIVIFLTAPLTAVTSVSAVTGLKAASASYTSIRLSWSAAAGAAYYQIYRSTSLTGTFTLIRTQGSSTRTYINTGLTTGKTYYYKVRGYGYNGSVRVYGGFSSIVSCKPIPATPTGLYVTQFSATSIKTGWNAVAGATRYQVARSTSLTGTYTIIMTTKYTSYLNIGLASGGKYYYKVRALHLEGSTYINGNYTSAKTVTNPLSLSNSALSWWYTRPSSTFMDRPATISSTVSSLISRYNVLWQKPISGRKVVYLTMDEGYEYNNNTIRILDIAKAKNVKITFFVTGSYIKNNTAIVKRMVAEGHRVANHTTTHPRLDEKVASGGEAALIKELTDVETAFKTLTGKTMIKSVRPPEGRYSERVLAYLTRNGYQTVFWSFAYRDWITTDQPNPTTAKTLILGELHNGSVLLLHAVSDTNVSILPALIDGIRARGYEIVLP